MATITAPKRDARLDLRMRSEEREEIERAASLKGMTITQWALQKLTASAREDIQEETVTRLSMQAFYDFKAALDQGMPAEAKDLINSKAVWE
ncbi:MAG: DUF1778 domain-containing protein [Coriobacteriia bacterium]|nr:DUF1778 domain-containing protein [Coriobacteriia bacterium]